MQAMRSALRVQVVLLPVLFVAAVVAGSPLAQAMAAAGFTAALVGLWAGHRASRTDSRPTVYRRTGRTMRPRHDNLRDRESRK